MSIDKQTGEVKSDSILEFAQGAYLERADYETQKILQNIYDINTDAKTKRSLTIKIDFMPSEDRKFISAKTTVKATLAPTTSISTSMTVVKQGDMLAAIENTAQIPGQVDINGKEQEPGKRLQFKLAN